MGIRKRNYKKAQIILADPPWHFTKWSDKVHRTNFNNHYNTLTDVEIKLLPIKEVCDRNCILFLWATFPNLLQCIETIYTWGFEYKTVAFVWVKYTVNGKLHRGMGYYTRANAELCLIGTRGKTIKRINKSVFSILTNQIKSHSEKPYEVHKRIEQLFGDIPRIELFARKKRPGWVCMGNEISGKDIREELKEYAKKCTTQE